MISGFSTVLICHHAGAQRSQFQVNCAEKICDLENSADQLSHRIKYEVCSESAESKLGQAESSL